jgi:hypothetical protein
MDGNQLLLELIKITDMKIDLMEYVIEKIADHPEEEQRTFVETSSMFDKIDWLNMEFLTNYQRFLRHEGIREIGQISIEKYDSLRDLKHLIGYALELETTLDAFLNKL